MDAGDLATWVGSGFAAIAAGATLWTLKSQRQQITEQRGFIAKQSDLITEQAANLLLEREELRAALADRRISQAQMVTMEASESVGTTAHADRNGDPIANILVVEMHNASSEPLHDVTAHFGGEPSSSGARLTLATLRGGDRWVAMGSPTGPVVPTMGGGEHWRFSSETDAIARGGRPHLVFTDNNGVRWQLDEYGGLREFR
ncbi:hypothetical protein [Streptomyces sp. NPDC046925]|uniref:hypothetical protein n=1 Tax=Streptomyces sp. NPDC046925 TaxID=3155375 RepID=UPI0033D9F6C4